MDYKKLVIILATVCSITLISMGIEKEKEKEYFYGFVLYGNIEAERKGNSQVSQESAEKIIKLQHDNIQLNDTLMELQDRITKLELANEVQIAEENQTAVYELRLTPRKGNFDEVREMCRQMGGDLMQKSLLINTSGGSYQEKYRNISAGVGRFVYIGITDLEVEGNWKYLNGEDFIEANSISSWDSNTNEPNGGTGENCGTALEEGNSETPIRINDDSCHGNFYGVCEIKI